MQSSQNTPYGGIPLSGTPTPSNIPPANSLAPRAKQETGIAGIAHLSSFFAPLVVPLIIWLVVHESMPYAARQAKQAFFFHLTMVVLGVVSAMVLWFFWVSTLFATVSQAITSNVPIPPSPPAWLYALFTFVIIIGLTGQALSIYGAVQAFQSKGFSYPGLHWL